MNIESLKYFLCIIKHNSFSLAAEELCISQSAISKHVKKLETELNCVLFDRYPRHINLTPAGVMLKDYASTIVNNYNEMMLKLNEYSYNNPKLSIGYIPVITQYNITSYIGNFKKKYSNLDFILHEGEHDEILNLLLNHKIDFAFLRSDTINSKNLNISPLVEDELVIIVPKNHPLADKKYISLSKLSNEKFISLGKGSGVYNLFLDNCCNFSFVPKIICYNSRIENIIGLVSAGIGIAPLMKRSVKCFNTDKVSIVLLKEKIYSHFCLVHLDDKKLSKTELAFKDYLINSLN